MTTPDGARPFVEAAGGIVWRGVEPGVEVLLVHRPAHHDWTFPKGKPHPGEEPHQTARREVWEETGFTCRITGVAGMIHYVTGGADKLVRYWAMRPVDGQFAVNKEVDEIRWLPVGEAIDQLSYRHDRELLASVDPLRWSRTSAVYLVRHADAGERSAWAGDDRLRPLSAAGWEQAHGLVSLLRFTGIEQLLSSAATRCVQTFEPLAEDLELKIEPRSELAEDVAAETVDALLAEVTGSTVALCSHGEVIEALLGRLAGSGVEVGGDDLQKGSTWMLEAVDRRLRRATYLPPTPPEKT